MKLTEQDIAGYQKNGVIFLKGLFSSAAISSLRDGVNEVIASPDERSANMPIGVKGNTYLSAHYASLTTPQIRKFIAESPMKNVVKLLTNSKQVSMLYDHILVKEPHTSQRTPWHQDGAYFPVSGENVLSIWVPMDPVTKTNGSMGFLPGSHRLTKQEILAKVPQKDSMDKGKLVHALPDFDQWPDLFEIFSWDFDLGDAVAFDARTMHFAHGNQSVDTRRRAIAFRWFGEGTEISSIKEHILNHPKIVDFIHKQGYRWDQSLSNPLFPTF